MTQDRKYVIINPQGASSQELNNWQVVRALIDAINSQDLGKLITPAGLKATHATLVDMPDTDNADHDGRYLRLNQTVPEEVSGGAPKFSDNIDLNGSDLVNVDVVSAATDKDLTVTTSANKTFVLTVAGYADDNAGSLVLITGGTLPGVVELIDNVGAGTGIYVRGFAVGDQGSVVTEYPHNGKEDSHIIFHVHWTTNDAPSGTDYVKWQIKYSICRDGATTKPSTTIVKETAVDTRYKQVRTDFDQIDIADLHIGDQISYSISRVASAGDAFGGEALVKTIGYHYPVDTLCSRTIGTK